MTLEVPYTKLVLGSWAGILGVGGWSEAMEFTEQIYAFCQFSDLILS